MCQNVILDWRIKFWYGTDSLYSRLLCWVSTNTGGSREMTIFNDPIFFSYHFSFSLMLDIIDFNKMTIEGMYLFFTICFLYTILLNIYISLIKQFHQTILLPLQFYTFSNHFKVYLFELLHKITFLRLFSL